MKKISKKFLAGALALTMLGSIPVLALEGGWSSVTNSVSINISEFVNVKNGVYKNAVYTITGGTGKTKLACDKITVENGMATATIVISSGKYPKVTVNGVEYLKENTDETGETSSVFTFPIDSYTTVFTGTSTAMSTPKDINYTLDITKLGHKEYQGVMLDNGKYSTTVESNNKMFKVENCIVTVSGEAMTADITLSGTGYDKLYMGTASEAGLDQQNGNTEEFIGYITDNEGKYVFSIPLWGFDEPIEVAAHAVKSGNWFDRELTFSFDNLKSLSDGTTSIPPSATPPAVTTAPVETIEPSKIPGGSFKRGDVNGDGSVDLTDVMVVLKAAVGIGELEGDYKTAADIDGDGQVTLDDVMSLLKVALGIIKIEDVPTVAK